uniref:TNFR-Cys domain-containing protein n=1 Tax=Caenorhabditis tropicalis TaxID=1561998 RepID=A0A1I7TCT1_9PELO
MGDTLKFLLLFLAVAAVTGKVYRKLENKCLEGQFSFKGTCFPCTPCGNFMYEQEKCSATFNTVCGWCGKKPNLDEISDEVMASYQTKCLMSSLDFIGMTKLKDDIMSKFEDEPQLKVKITSRKGSSDGEGNGQDNFKIAKDALFNLDDSVEQELPDPTLEEGRESSEEYVDGESDHDENNIREMIEDESRYVDENEDGYVDENENGYVDENESGYVDENEIRDEDENDTEDDKSVEVIEAQSNEDQEFPENEEFEEDKTEISSAEAVDEYDGFISDRVRAFLIRKMKQQGDEPMEWEMNPFLKRATIVSLKEVQDQFENFLPPVPIVKSKNIMWKGSSESSDESVEREIKWDSWVDDEVKPIGESVEIVEAEEISQKYEAYEKITRNFREDDQNPLKYFNKKVRINEDTYINPIVLVALALIIIFTIVSLYWVQIRADHKSFAGVPTDCQDYHMIVNASKYLEELEEKEKKASRHVHVNPVFDV